jgi:hypothetical protein
MNRRAGVPVRRRPDPLRSDRHSGPGPALPGAGSAVLAGAGDRARSAAAADEHRGAPGPTAPRPAGPGPAARPAAIPPQGVRERGPPHRVRHRDDHIGEQSAPELGMLGALVAEPEPGADRAAAHPAARGGAREVKGRQLTHSRPQHPPRCGFWHVLMVRTGTDKTGPGTCRGTAE